MPPSGTILIVDDDSLLRAVYKRRFSKTPFNVMIAEDAENAAAMIRSFPPDLLICDILMPGKDGWWLLGQFPKTQRSFPVIVLTNLDDEDTKQRCEDLEVDDYVVKKNMSLSKLTEKATSLLEKHAD
jgi:DNA-binding response OmpR family regulator